MAFPTMTTTVTANQASGTSYNVNMPASVAEKQRLVMIVHTFVGQTINLPSGWTTVSSQTALLICEKIADGTEGGTTVAVTAGTSTQWDAITLLISGSALQTSLAYAHAAGTTTSTPDCPSLTPSFPQGDTLWVAIGRSTGGTATGFPTNYNLNQTGTNILGVAARQLNAATEDPGTFTFSASSTAGGGTLAIPQVRSLPPFPRRLRFFTRSFFESLAELMLRLRPFVEGFAPA